MIICENQNGVDTYELVIAGLPIPFTQTDFSCLKALKMRMSSLAATLDLTQLGDG